MGKTDPRRGSIRRGGSRFSLGQESFENANDALFARQIFVDNLLKRAVLPHGVDRLGDRPRNVAGTCLRAGDPDFIGSDGLADEDLFLMSGLFPFPQCLRRAVKPGGDTTG